MTLCGRPPARQLLREGSWSSRTVDCEPVIHGAGNTEVRPTSGVGVKKEGGVQGRVGDQGGDKGDQEKRSVIITGFSVN